MKQFLRKMLLMAAIVVAPLATQAQLLADCIYSTGVDSTQWYTLTSTTSLITSTGDGARSTVQDIGFSFPFDGGTYTQYSVNADGNLRLGPTQTGTGNYSTPFSATNAAQNNPKINGMGCDGFLTDSGYVHAQVFGTAPSRVLVVEFATSTYSTGSRNSLLRWQVQLSESGMIKLVYGSAPPITPAVPTQVGMCSGANSIWVIDFVTNQATYLTAGATATNAAHVWPAPYRYYQFLPFVPTCSRPFGVIINNITDASAHLAFLDTNTTSSWVLEYANSPFVPGTGNGTVENLTDTSYDFSALASNTTYYCYLHADCGSGDTSQNVSFSFRTLCVPIDDTQLPYTEDFEAYGYGTTAFPSCWFRLGSTDNRPNISSSTSEGRNGTHGLYYYAAPNGYCYAIMPSVAATLEINTLQLNFYARQYSSSYDCDIQVGVMTDPTNASTFTTVATMHPSGTTYELFEVPMTQYTGMGTYIALRAVVHPGASSSSIYMLIDDVTLDEIPSCSRPMNLEVIGATSDGITLSWNEVGTATEWNIVYDTLPIVDSNIANYSIIPVSTNPATITGLDESTTYYFKVQSDCGSDQSAWSINEAVGTSGFSCSDGTYAIVALPSDATNSNVPYYGNWGNGVSQTIYTASELNDMGLYEGYLRSMRLEAVSVSSPKIKNQSIYLGTTSLNTLTTLLPDTNFSLVWHDSANVIEVGVNNFVFDSAFYWDGTSNLVVMFINSQDSSSLATSGTPTWRVQNYAGGALCRYVDNTPMNISNYMTLGSTTTTQNYRPSWVFEGCVTIPDCPRPVNLSVDSVNATEIYFSWTERGAATSWNFIVSDTLVTDFTEWTPQTASYTNTNASGLNPNTAYYIYVQSGCGSDWSTVLATRTECDIFNLPFRYGFEGTWPDPCWGYVRSNTSSTVTSNTSYYHEGSQAAYVYASGVGSDVIISMPLFEQPLNNLEVNFWVYHTTTTQHAMNVGYMTDRNDISTFTTVASITLNTNGPWIEYTVDMPDTAPANAYIAFQGHAYGSSGYFYLDDITVMEKPTCIRPVSVDTSNVTATSATIAWVDTSAGNPNYYIEYAASDITPGMGIGMSDFVTDTFCTLTGLIPNTLYHVYVASVCGTGDTSAYRVITFRTACAPINATMLPYTEDFESYGTGDAAYPSCWYRMSSTANRPYIYSATSYGHNDSHGLYFYATSTGYCYSIMPPVDDAINVSALQVSFFARRYSSSNNSSIVVGVMSDPTNISTFVAVDTVHPATIVYEEFDVPLNTYTDTGKYIAFQAITNASSTIYMLLDDVTLDSIPPCIRPSDLAVNDVNVDEIKISWGERGTATSWVVEWDTVDFTPGAGTPMGNVTVTDTFYTIMGLNAGEQYYIYVYSSCGSVNSSAVGITASTLTSAPATLPYATGFDSADEWYLVGDGQVNHWAIFNSKLAVTNDGSTNTYTISSAISHSYAWKPIRIDSAGSYVAYYTWSGSGESSYDFARLFLVPMSFTPTAGTAPDGGTSSHSFDANVLPTGFISLDNASRLNQQATMQTNMVEFVVTTPGTYRLLAYWGNDVGGGTQPPTSFDTMSIFRAACPTPYSGNVSGATTTGATLSWKGIAASYYVEIGARAFTTADTTLTVNDTVAVITGLLNSSDYEAHVHSICDNDTAERFLVIPFSTLCGTISVLPYTHNFDNMSTSTISTDNYGIIPTCWTSKLVSTNPSYTSGMYRPGPYYSTTYSSSGSYCYRLCGVGYMALPEMAASIDSLQLSFYFKATNTSYLLEVGVVDSVWGDWEQSFVSLATVGGTTTGTNYTISLSSYAGTGHYICLYNHYLNNTNDYSYVYFDDIEVNYLPACAGVTDVTGIDSLSTGTSVTITWTDRGYATNEWDIEYDTVGFTRGTGRLTRTTTKPFVINGLENATAYDVYVRPACDTLAGWVHGTVYTMLCDSMRYATTENGTSHTTTALYPAHSLYNYSFSETIIDSAEIAAAGYAPGDEISGILLEVTALPTTMHMSNIQLYLANTTQSTFTGFVNVDSTFQKVFDGNMNNMQVGWNGYVFDTVFVWNGGNVMLAFDRNDGGYLGGLNFRTTSCTGNKTIYQYSDTRNILPDSASLVSGSRTEKRANMRLYTCGSVAPRCNAPVVTSTTTTYQSATIAWSATAANFEVAVKAVSAPEWPATNTAVNAAYTYTFAGLQPTTTYMYRLRAVCDSVTTSNWTEGRFLTDSLPCFAPTNLTVDGSFGSAELSWTAGSNETQWRIHVWNTTFDSVYTANANPYTATGLTPGTDYRAAVAAVCGGGLLVSDYSDTISIRTNTCDVPTGLATSNVTANSVHVTWNAGANNTGKWIVEYGVEGYVSGQGTEVTVTSASADLTGLESELTYDVYVRAVCDDAYPSGWSNKASFTTHGVGIDNVGASHVTLFPNPAANSTTVSVNGVEGMVTITVVDMNGRAVRTETVECSSDCTKTMDIDSLAAGAYFVRIQGGGINVVKKLVVR